MGLGSAERYNDIYDLAGERQNEREGETNKYIYIELQLELEIWD